VGEVGFPAGIGNQEDWMERDLPGQRVNRRHGMIKNYFSQDFYGATVLDAVKIIFGRNVGSAYDQRA